MAIRNPTDWTRWVILPKFTAGRMILTTEFNKVIEDQHYTLDAEALVLSDSFPQHARAAAAWSETSRHYVKSKDMCTVAGVVNNEISHEWCVLMWRSAAGAAGGTVRLTSTAVVANVSTIVVGALTLTPTWYGFGTLNIKTNDIEDMLLFEARRDAGAGVVYVGGFGVFALET